MNAPAPLAGWYPDPQNPTRQRYWDGIAWASDKPRVGVAAVFGRTFAYLLGIAVLTGIVSGTVGMPIFGTIFGLVAGFGIGIPVALITAAVIAAAARPMVTPKTYRRCIDVTLVVLFVATVALAVVWINQQALVGPWPAYTMLVLVAVCFIAVRPLLRRLVPEQATST
ncbi:MAG: DUF2510 domain-containing protein [Aeromicrobium sp.]